MNKLILLLFLFTTQLGFSQNDEPLLERKGNLVHNQYFILGQEVSERQVLKKMKPYEPARKMFKSSRRLAFTSSVIAALGLGTFMPSIFDPTPEVTVPLLMTGVSLIAIAVPIKSKANRKADEALELYNARKLMGENEIQPEFHLKFTATGLGLIMTF